MRTKNKLDLLPFTIFVLGGRERFIDNKESLKIMEDKKKKKD